MTTVIGIPMIFIAVPTFALLFTVISKTLQQRPLLGGNADVILSLCVAALCVISVFRVTPVPTASSSQDPMAATAIEDTTEDKSDRPLFEFILLPYAALLLTLPLVWLLKLFSKREDGRHLRSDTQYDKDHKALDRQSSLSRQLTDRTQT